jgi:hypothetical protein
VHRAQDVGPMPEWHPGDEVGKLGRVQPVYARRRCPKLKRVTSPRGNVQITPIDELAFEPPREPPHSETTQEGCAANLHSHHSQLAVLEKLNLADTRNASGVDVDYL